MGQDRPRNRTSRAPVLACLAWAAFTTGGMLVLNAYSNSDGAVGDVSSNWPADAGLDKPPGRFTLLMFVHPRCPCSQASVEQLARIHARCRDRLAMRVLFYTPAAAPDDWARTRLWTSAQRIPGAVLALDRDGKLAERFGARTSGHVSLHDPDGRLVFHGGITAGRGHEGACAGTEAVIACLRGRASTQVSVPVFGCALSSQPQLGPGERSSTRQSQISPTTEVDRPQFSGSLRFESRAGKTDSEPTGPHSMRTSQVRSNPGVSE